MELCTPVPLLPRGCRRPLKKPQTYSESQCVVGPWGLPARWCGGLQ